MNPFDKLLGDAVRIRKKDGTLSRPYKCNVQPNQIRIMESVIDVEEGDSVERELPNGKIETYAVLEAQFSKGQHSIPDSRFPIHGKNQRGQAFLIEKNPLKRPGPLVFSGH